MPAVTARPAPAAPPRWLWALLVVPAALLFCCYQYVDNAATTQHGINVWRSLSEGKLLQFYSYNDAFTPESPYFWHFGSAYGFAMYVVFALWDLPLFLLQQYAHLNVFMNFFTLLWAKSITLPFLAGTVWAMRRLSSTLGLSRRQWLWASFLLLSSVFVLETVVIMGQYDIIHVFVTLLAVDAWLRGRRAPFLALAAAAVALKWFPLLVVLPLLLLVEKRLLRVAWQVLLVLAPALVLMVPFAFDHARQGGGDLLGQMLLAGQLDIGFGLAPFVAAYGAACVVAWLIPAPDAAARARWGMFAAAAPFCLLLLLVPAYPYWFVIPAPYLALLMVQRPARLRVLLVLELGWAAAITFCHMVVNHFTWDWPTVAPMILPRLFGSVDKLALNVSFIDYLTNWHLVGLRPIASSAALVLGTALLWVASPWSRGKGIDDDLPVADAFARARGLLVARTVLGLAVCSVAALVYLWCRFHHGLA